eukprot:CAMPEP_0172500880 /NCGR_PEP_ID=MMETSP1066-20121228/143962_1 /TAXON_ID=671091 /ORGANISM="Coscinodiscus wailesii, Strain CCMP2513" /LENGTH=621 /DNA_ID=CAMNT_0013275361 /DNA_START=324 /DNA_END=2186 /DNA_ORIENTATION=+
MNTVVSSNSSSGKEHSVPQVFSVDDIVEIYGLVNATHLNGKIARITTNSASGDGKQKRWGVRLTPFFIEQECDKEPIAIKTSNLRQLSCLTSAYKKRDKWNGGCNSYPRDRDDPHIGFKVSPGSDRQRNLLIEAGGGKVCGECGKCLKECYHVYDEASNRWLCEEHYVKINCGNSSPLLRYCWLCYGFIGCRDGALCQKREWLDEIISACNKGVPELKLLTYDRYWHHKGCHECYLCGKDMAQEPKFDIGIRMIDIEITPQTLENNAATRKRPIMLCRHCNDDWDDVQAANKQLEQYNDMSTQQLRTILRGRKIRCSANEEKNDLVRKVIVMDHNTNCPSPRDNNNGDDDDDVSSTPKEEKSCALSCHVVPSSQAAAPGRYLINRRCTHGCHSDPNATPDHVKKREQCQAFIQSLGGATNNNTWEEESYYQRIHLPSGANERRFYFQCMDIFDYWFKHQDELRADIEQRFIPRYLWATAVRPMIVGQESSTRMSVTSSVIVNAMMDKLAALMASNCNRACFLTQQDLSKMFFKPGSPLGHYLEQIGKSDTSLYQFMNSQEHKSCDCMQYVATAATMGVLRKNRVIDVNKCGNCQTYLRIIKRCPLCDTVAYCDESCQKEHW